MIFTEDNFSRMSMKLKVGDLVFVGDDLVVEVRHVQKSKPKQGKVQIVLHLRKGTLPNVKRHANKSEAIPA